MKYFCCLCNKNYPSLESVTEVIHYPPEQKEKNEMFSWSNEESYNNQRELPTCNTQTKSGYVLKLPIIPQCEFLRDLFFLVAMLWHCVRTHKSGKIKCSSQFGHRKYKAVNCAQSWLESRNSNDSETSPTRVIF